MSTALEVAHRILREGLGDRVRSEVPLAPLTTFRIGGPAALYVEPENDEDLSVVHRAVRESGLPFVVVGKGSNLLIADRGFAGIVLRLGKGYRWAARDRDRLRAGGAMPLPALAGVALRHGLGGLEFGVAIPATLGGAVKMNAGAHDAEMGDVVARVDLFRILDGERVTVGVDEAGFSYRASALPDDAVVLAATLQLHDREPGAIRAGMEDARAWRRRTQPLAEPNCGSVFTNPPGAHAAALIEAAGLKRARIGGAAVSGKHANFIVADPGASAADVVALIALVQERVAADSGVRLEPEVRFVGSFDDDAA
jgi:UDP-N-acetylmuramate dehydrogenase